jgi:alpha-tubulin suppressor-like RCC1 family protein
VYYPINPVMFTVGEPGDKVSPVVVTGQVGRYSIFPALPPGLSIDPQFGTISGTPAEVSPLATYTVTASNKGHTIAFQIGIGVAAPCQYETLPPTGIIAGSQGDTCTAICGAQCWGSNTFAQLGTGSGSTSSPVPLDVLGLSNGVQQIAVGEDFACALVEGEVVCWGSWLGCLPQRLKTVCSPEPIAGLGGRAQAVAAGGLHACALVGGNVECWGIGTKGEIGNPIGSSPSPVAIMGQPGPADAIAAGESHTCALIDGGVFCWGDNSSGQLGVGGSVPPTSNAPVPVQGLSSGVTAIAANSLQTCALTAAGVWCWGRWQFEGVTSTPDPLAGTFAPVLMAGTAGATAIAVGTDHVCMLIGGGVQCLGQNDFDQLGDGTSNGSLSPVQVSGLQSGVISIGAGPDHTCALQAGGALWCWGQNSGGELGNPSVVTATVPVPVNLSGT